MKTILKLIGFHLYGISFENQSEEITISEEIQQEKAYIEDLEKSRLNPKYGNNNCLPLQQIAY